MFAQGNYFANRCVFATVWACREDIPTHFNYSLRSTKAKGATNKRFNSWQRPKPCGVALERQSNKSHRSMSRLYWLEHALGMGMWHLNWHGRKARR